MAFTVVQKLDKDPKDITPDYTLDTLGEPCPYPAIVMLETMPQLQKGEILELLSDCAQSINNIPVDTKNHGYTLLSVEQDGTKLRYLIQRECKKVRSILTALFCLIEINESCNA